jgi:hypothetical protein
MNNQTRSNKKRLAEITRKFMDICRDALADPDTSTATKLEAVILLEDFTRNTRILLEVEQALESTKR